MYKKTIKTCDSGMSLIEVMIAVTVLSIILLGALNVFFSVSKGLIVTGARTTSTILVRDKIESMKGIPFSRLVPTTRAALTNPEDSSNPYPPETFTINRKAFTRITTIEKVRENASGNLEVIDPDDPSEGLKQIQVEVRWTDPGGEQKSLTMENLIQDPNRSILNGKMEIKVRYNPASPTNLAGASVYVVENMNWKDTSDSNGDCVIYVTTGTYHVTAMKRGYNTQTRVSTVTASTPATVSFVLSATAVGTISGTVYLGTTTTSVRGAVITCDDGTSTITRTIAGGTYSLTSVATGYWTVMASSTSLSLMGRTTDVHVTNGGTTSGVIIRLDTSISYGSISGRVTSGGLPVNDITVSAANYECQTNLTGEYMLTNVQSSSYTVTANPEPANNNYTTGSTANVYVASGQNTPAIDIALEPGGDIRGTVRITGGDPLPNIIIRAVDDNDIEQDVEMSGDDGIFTFERLPAGSNYNNYVLTPVLNPDDSSSPANRTITVTQGVLQEHDTGTNDIIFTITPSKGNIWGTVTSGGNPITSGVLIVASSGTITTPPPTINSAFRSGSNIFYGTVSDVEGNYFISVTWGKIYNMAAWYSTISGETVTTTRQNVGSVNLTVSTSAAVNFAW